MTQSASRSVPSCLSARHLPQISRTALAAALFGLFVTFRPAYAQVEVEYEHVTVPGEGPPYVSRLDPRYWPPMPDRNPYMHHEHHGYASAPSSDYDAPPPYRKKPRVYVKQHKDHEPEHYAPDEHRPALKHYAGDGDKYVRGNEAYPDRNYIDENKDEGKGFGRLFPAADQSDAPYHPSFKALQALGRSLVEDLAPDDPAGDSEMPAGYTFLGQFIDHDLTLDTTTDLGHEIQGDYQLENARTPDLDLDSVYGGGPKRTPHLYRLPYIRVGKLISADDESPRYDLFRTKASYYYGPSGGKPVALLGDPRNDENVVVSQLHAAFVAFHNRTVDILVEHNFGPERDRFCERYSHCGTHELADALADDLKQKIFEAAQNHVIHFYHRLILEDFLPRVIGPKHTANLIKKGRDFFFPDGFSKGDGPIADIFIPVEFAVAAFRYGHSQVRDSYVLRDGVKFDLLSSGYEDGPRAFEPVTPRFLVDWRYFFEVDHKPPYGFNQGRLIDPELVKSLHQLSFSNVVGMDEVSSLAARNLARSKTQLLPSGQQVARIVLPALEARGLLGSGDYGRDYGGPLWKAYLLPPDERTAYFLGEAETPLWYYILQEASIFGGPTHLHTVPYDGYKKRHLSHYDPAHYRPDHYGPNLFRRAALRYPRGGYPGGDEGYGDKPYGGHRLGPVGATIVGEVLIGLVEHYREKTGHGLDFEPEVQASESVLAGKGYGKRAGHAYTMRDFLIDAGVVDEKQ